MNEIRERLTRANLNYFLDQHLHLDRRSVNGNSITLIETRSTSASD